ncbi:HAMP domain-containing sensor histidine kinase [Nocardioides sp. CN2-186]|uniref:sensor histidine kinase n=1 Tax=Nocardioides tweenelious TaxID=3156607 RepID=UPI0032B53FA7
MSRYFASLTSRLVVTTVLLVLVVSVLIGTATTLAMHRYLFNQLDSQVTDTMDRTIHGGPGPVLGSEVGTVTGGFPDDGDASGIILEDNSGAPATRQPLTDAAVADLGTVPSDGDFHTIDLSGLGSYRAQAQDVTGGTIVVGLPSQDVDDTLQNLVELEAILTLVAVVVAAGAALVVVRRQLRPLREVAATAHSVSELPLAEGEIELTERVPEHLTDERTEVGQVGAALNTLLEHVGTSLAARHRSEQQVRQFVADASHELRSPLATIAGYTELARRRPDDAGVVGTALDKVEEESGRMTSLVEDLLLLARLDSGRPLERRPVDLTRLLLEAVSDARVVAPDHRWRLDVPDDAVDAAYEVSGDELRLHQVVTNLLTNARKYTPAGTTVTVTVRRDGFAVHDDGPGFPPGLAEHAFERFARGDTARTRGAEVGVGLGLALVEAIVTAHGGRVSLASRPGDTTVDVSLPR